VLSRYAAHGLVGSAWPSGTSILANLASRCGAAQHAPMAGHHAQRIDGGERFGRRGVEMSVTRAPRVNDECVGIGGR
jgi:hypothetical protein